MKKYNRKKMKIISEERFVLNMSIVLLAIVVFSFFLSKNFNKNEVETYTYVVSNNDTIWNISKTVCDNSKKNLDIQYVVKDIKNRNNLNSSDIFLGQVIEIPIY